MSSDRLWEGRTVKISTHFLGLILLRVTETDFWRSTRLNFICIDTQLSANRL